MGTVTQVSRGTGVALWRQIREVLVTEIACGSLTPGTRIPTEEALAKRFAVNRHTVRQAVGAMADEGLLRIEHGRGMFVQETVIHYEVRKRTRFTENVARQSLIPESRFLEVRRIPADETVAKALDLATHDPVVRIWRLGHANEKPICLSAHHFCAQRFAQLEIVCQITDSVTEALQHLGIEDYRRQVTRVTTRMPTRREAKLLAQSEKHPVLVSESINIDPTGHPIEYGVTAFCGDRVEIVFEPS